MKKLKELLTFLKNKFFKKKVNNTKIVDKLDKKLSQGPKKSTIKKKVVIFLENDDFNALDELCGRYNVTYTKFCEFAIQEILSLYEYRK